jgi:hypothetical protein
MYLYLSMWLAASAVVVALTVYRRALLRGGMAIAFCDPDFDMKQYEAAFRRRLKLVDRWVRAVALGCPGTVFGHAMLRILWQALHSTFTWQALRAAVAR